MSDTISLSTGMPDLSGMHYTKALQRLHNVLSPKAYFEIGTETGQSLAYAKCPTLAVDPNFRIEASRMAQLLKKEASFFFSMESDAFFSKYDPTHYLGNLIDLAFLDGLHWCEFLLRDFINTEKYCDDAGMILLHDCLPVEPAMADRIHGARRTERSHRQGKWAGDVWKTAIALKRHRPDLIMTAIDAAPTGLLIISGLDCKNGQLHNAYDAIVEEMNSLDLDSLGIEWLFSELNIQSSELLDSDIKIKGLRVRQATLPSGMLVEGQNVTCMNGH